ncbi:MAG: hypothetical protein M0C28_12735 [Candidatus Moduliflexus flocculans]|nr:hypothetical protein [Candidatus Moduliflexus flocculans]
MNADLFTRLFAAFGLLLVAAAAAPFVSRKRALAGIVNLGLVSVAAVLLLTVSAEALFGHAGHAARTVSLGPLAVPFLVDGFSGGLPGDHRLHGRDERPLLDPLHGPLPGVRPGRLLSVLSRCSSSGMAGLVTVDDLAAGFTLAWQVMTVASFFLVRFEHRKTENVRNAAKYLALMELAWLFVIAGTVFVDGYRFGEPLAGIAAKLGATARPAAPRLLRLPPRRLRAEGRRLAPRPALAARRPLDRPVARERPAERGHAQDRRSTG